MTDDPNRKDFRREKIIKKKYLDEKKDHLDDPDRTPSKKNNQLKQKKHEIEEEEWEDWDRYYNH